jgi:hypothetical protein
MSGVKAKLKVVLQADDTVVAESEDGQLWQRVLLAINKGPDSVKEFDSGHQFGGGQTTGREPLSRTFDTALEPSDDVGRFAQALGITAAVVQGACSPSRASPFLTLDMHCWNAMKEQTPARGIGAISPMALAATLLAFWAQQAKLTAATQAEAQKVLATINLRDANAARSIQQAGWLQSRPGGVVVINPARVKRAVAIAKAFCTQDWTSDLTWKGSAAE